MNELFICGQNIGAITNNVKADLHKHWLLQIFVAVDEKLVIKVEGQKISCRAIVINANIMHEFQTGEVIHFTMLINPTSLLGRSIRKYYLRGNPYYILSEDRAIELQKLLLNHIKVDNSNDYSEVIKNVYHYFDNKILTEFDQRIESMLRMLNTYHSDKTASRVKYIAKAMYLSESRLSHLFKEETGIPLKSYLVHHNLLSVYEKIFDGESITDAALGSGFDSSAHFAYTNKKMTGMSARDIIKNSRFLKASF
ncbi:helix-turn-helix domain-containing protein [Evansella cellulosilytica]|uniref:Helix-turn-helix, AraC domain n=1 Tax=Evansella cellulosilytica (strain ATCC 21833 / DSM 2522 / FERM P-1141 / JCM 9156 / N-4) TaxID=649639 RepID=E6U0P9_EVAC2|nr:helix-turn-helix domain-containing protein [Evansella cellulosilytica]ADU29097.1 Helix-turn-helix, AraC domain [Evansella cellulosilytica DSM 2522]